MRRAALLIFALAVALRVAVLSSPLVPVGYVLVGAHKEVDNVAQSLATTGRFADPYVIPTGPTAHPLPIHTGLQALIYAAFGTTPEAAYCRSMAGIVACAAAFALLPWLSRRLGFGLRPGVAAGLVAALVPLQGMNDVLGWLWNEAMAAVALALLLGAFVARWQAPDRVTATGSAGLGLGAGAAFHLAPALLPVVAGLVAFELWWVRDRRKRVWAAALACGVLLACAPWGWRLYRTFGEVMFIRSNFGLELRLGNHDGATADLWSATPGPRQMHPGNNPAEARLVKDLGEAAYMARLRNETLDWIRSHPWAFLRLTAQRAWLVWFGPPGNPVDAVTTSAITALALMGYRRARPQLDAPQRAAVIIPLAAYPLVYYLVGYVPRYLFPTSGLLLVLAASAIVRRTGATTCAAS